MSLFYSSAPKIIIICCTVTEIRSEPGIIFCHLGHFLPFYPPTNDRKMKNLKKWKKTPKKQTNKQTKKKPGDIIFLHMCTINEDGSWDIRCNRQNFLKFWAIFSPFSPPDDPGNQNFEKISLEILSFYTCKP